MIDGFMLIAIVNRGEARKIMTSARLSGARGGTVSLARGTASSTVLAALGWGDSKKEILYSMLSPDIKDEVVESIRKVKVKNSGIMILLDCRREKEEATMAETNWEMIQVICEEGYAEDVMAAARSAGAKGGTVINARGTASPEDVKFFGYPLASEKEMLVIVTPKEASRKIMDAISALDCLKTKGKGIAFSIPVSSFYNLGQ